MTISNLFSWFPKFWCWCQCNRMHISQTKVTCVFLLVNSTIYPPSNKSVCKMWQSPFFTLDVYSAHCHRRIEEVSSPNCFIVQFYEGRHFVSFFVSWKSFHALQWAWPNTIRQKDYHSVIKLLYTMHSWTIIICITNISSILFFSLFSTEDRCSSRTVSLYCAYGWHI